MFKNQSKANSVYRNEIWMDKRNTWSNWIKDQGKKEFCLKFTKYI